MSATTTPPPTAATTNAIAKSTTTATLVQNLGDALQSGARDAPAAIKAVAALDPALAAQMQGKSLAMSKTPWGTLAASGVLFLAAKYGLACAVPPTPDCWTPDTINLIAGFAAMGGAFVGSFIMRTITSLPITGWFSTKPTVKV